MVRTKGRYTINWIDARNGDPDVFVRSSRDGGETWSTPVRINDDPIKNGKVQFFTWMSVDPIDGSVNSVFTIRGDTEGALTKITLARSIDGGHSFVNYKIDVPPFVCDPKVFFGDYSGISATTGTWSQFLCTLTLKKAGGFSCPISLQARDTKANQLRSQGTFHFECGLQLRKSAD